MTTGNEKTITSAELEKLQQRFMESKEAVARSDADVKSATAELQRAEELCRTEHGIEPEALPTKFEEVKKSLAASVASLERSMAEIEKVRAKWTEEAAPSD